MRYTARVPWGATTAIGILAAIQTVTASYERETPRCPPAARYCFGIELFVVFERGEPVRPASWFAGQLRHANELFSPIGVGFELDALRVVHPQWAHVQSRLDRDELGRRARKRGVVHVFMVRRLDDVDIDGNRLYGVHWRDRGRSGERWIIVSAKDESDTVFSHETGHYFGLPHSRYDVSIMNKSPRETPSWPERVFAPPELERMTQKRDDMVESGFLRNRAQATR